MRGPRRTGLRAFEPARVRINYPPDTPTLFSAQPTRSLKKTAAWKQTRKTSVGARVGTWHI